jgi:DNA repair protein RecN (Recombination protein N)
MLDELTVENLGLIPNAHLEPGPGLVVISGETGTGKTLLLGALRLLRGESARKDQIGPNATEAIVQARFVSDGEERVLGRRVDRSRSRATVDGALATAGNLTEVLSGVLDVVGQNDRTVLSEPRAVRRAIDAAMDANGRSAIDRYTSAWLTYAEVNERATALGGDRRALERELDMVRFQRDEIDNAGFAPGDEEELGGRAGRLRNAEELRERLAAVRAAAGEQGAAESLERAVRELRAASRVDPSLGNVAELGEQLTESLSDFNTEVGRVSNDLDHDPRELDHVEQRLSLVADLKRKYGDDLDSVLEFGEITARRAEELEGLLDQSDVVEEELAEARADVADAVTDLRAYRQATGERIAAGAVVHLHDLGFSDPIVEFEIAERDPGPEGGDHVVLKFSSDRGLEPGPISKVASGGELSRLILALRLAAGAGDVAVVAFDEIDTGTGGTTALAMGRKLHDLSRGRQVLCVTHLPQVAAFADSHFVVRRDANTATVEKLQGDERLEELSRMLAGLPDSERGRAHAEELLRIAGTE